MRQSLPTLEGAFKETDMRPSYNPTRMGVIGELTTLLAKRLSCLCPACHTPGWGKVSAKGLRWPVRYSTRQ
ncbi:DUF6671 family protein [Spirosoma radiotolerans]|uniref:DUF6671 family protein n=1 Tax=Spirosoma radiotolerans TaxID=1379870 RepID=UPI00373FE40D